MFSLTPPQTAERKAPTPLPTLQKALNAKTDLCGEAARRQPNGPTYEFFERLLQPLRYVDAAFRHYPITLSAPAGPVKVRVISNGSAVNARPSLKIWKEAGTPVTFRVGKNRRVFGEYLATLYPTTAQPK